MFGSSYLSKGGGSQLPRPGGAVIDHNRLPFEGVPLLAGVLSVPRAGPVQPWPLTSFCASPKVEQRTLAGVPGSLEGHLLQCGRGRCISPVFHLPLLMLEGNV
jgi:hypothetical protein